MITFKRTKKVFVWVHENTIILNARLTGKQVITSIGYCGDALYRNKNLACGDIGFIDDIAKTVANVNERIKKTQGKDVYVAPVLLTSSEAVIKYDIFTKNKDGNYMQMIKIKNLI